MRLFEERAGVMGGELDKGRAATPFPFPLTLKQSSPSPPCREGGLGVVQDKHLPPSQPVASGQMRHPLLTTAVPRQPTRHYRFTTPFSVLPLPLNQPPSSSPLCELSSVSWRSPGKGRPPPSFPQVLTRILETTLSTLPPPLHFTRPSEKQCRNSRDKALVLV